MFVRSLGRIEATAVRTITVEDALRFERIHEEVYTELGYVLLDVPPAPLDARIQLVRDLVLRGA